MFIINKINNIKDSNKFIEKSIKSKTRNLSKLQKSEKSKNIKSKKLLKNGNLLNCSIKKVRPNFLISDTKKVFNYLQLVFIKASIF